MLKSCGKAACSYWVQGVLLYLKAADQILEEKNRFGRPLTELNKVDVELVESVIGSNSRISCVYIEKQAFLSHSSLN